MNVSYYTIDDLRLGRDSGGAAGWQMHSFASLDDALAHYRALPSAGVKSLGLTDGVHVLELARCHPLFPNDREGEDVLASDAQASPLWREAPDAAQAEDACVSVLRLRYRLDGERLVPIPKAKKLSKALKGLRLRPDRPGDDESAIRWAYVVGEGLIPPAALHRPRPALPLVLHYRVECVAEDGSIVTLKVSPWEFEQLAHRAKERRA